MINGETGEAGRTGLSERMLLLLLAAVQFTHIMDFMIMMPLGPQLMHDLEITPRQFGSLISSFSITSGIVMLIVAPFIDRFDRRNLLLVGYAGFAISTLACALSDTVGALMISRAVCGACGGVAGAAVMAIVSDVVPNERRGQAMGIIMTAFSVAAAFGVPFGLKLAQWSKWETPFFAVAGISMVVWGLIWYLLPAVRGHLDGGVSLEGNKRQRHFINLLRDSNAWMGLGLMAMLVLGHFTLIPYLAPYLVQNMGLPEEDLFLVYFLGGVATFFTGPLIGKLADRSGKLKVYTALVIATVAVVTTLTYLELGAAWKILVVTTAFFVFASSRFIPVQAVVSQAVEPRRRGAYMSLIACSRDLTAGISAMVGGTIITESPDGTILNYQWLGWLAITVSVASLLVFRKVREV